MGCEKGVALPLLPLLSLPPRPCDGDECPQLSAAKRSGRRRGVRDDSGREVPGATSGRCRGARYGSERVPRRGAREPETARGLIALPGEQGASALTCDPEGHRAKICRSCWWKSWWWSAVVSAWIDLPVCGFQPAGTEPSQASSWRGRGGRRGAIGHPERAIASLFGSVTRPWSWSRWAFDLLGKAPPESLIV